MTAFHMPMSKAVFSLEWSIGSNKQIAKNIFSEAQKFNFDNLNCHHLYWYDLRKRKAVFSCVTMWRHVMVCGIFSIFHNLRIGTKEKFYNDIKLCGKLIATILQQFLQCQRICKLCDTVSCTPQHLYSSYVYRKLFFLNNFKLNEFRFLDFQNSILF